MNSNIIMYSKCRNILDKFKQFYILGNDMILYGSYIDINSNI